MEDKEEKVTNNEELIKALREEYDKKFEEAEIKHKEQIEAINKQHIAEMRALLSGKTAEVTPPEQDEEPSFEEKLMGNLRKKYKLGD